MAAPCVHHVGVGVLDEKPVLKLLQEQLCFKLCYKRNTHIDDKWVLQKGSVIFVLTKLKLDAFDQTTCLASAPVEPACCVSSAESNGLVSNESASELDIVGNRTQHRTEAGEKCDDNDNPLSLPDFTSIWLHPSSAKESSSSPSTLCSEGSAASNRTSLHNNNCHNGLALAETGNVLQNITNSVYDISLEITDVSGAVERVMKLGAVVVRPLTVVKDDFGTITYATVRSCAGNVQHTLINSANYQGKFLPGFDVCHGGTGDHEDAVGELNYDHFAICVPPGETSKCLKWYEECFGMHRMIVNSNESPTDGLMLEDIGMRLAAMEYWRCAETGLSLGKHQNSTTIVFAESLVDSPNQVTTFIKQHGGPGVQHIGLRTERLVEVVNYLRLQGLPFVQPPPEYYQEISKLTEIAECGESVDLLERCGILLDSEADCTTDDIDKDQEPMSRYLMQIFTKPIFKDDTFFMEFLQRHGAHGFGAGNISALWKAVKLYLERNGVK